MKYLKTATFLLTVIFLQSCIGNMNPTGGNSSPDYPYFITTSPIVIKKIALPTGTKLIYEEQFLKEGEQEKMLSNSKLNTIVLPEGKTIIWGGVPVYRIHKFFNTEMRGFSVYADFSKLKDNEKTEFSNLWQSCSDDLGILVKDLNDWSFNPENISDISSCSVIYQRYFKENKEQQAFLDQLLRELNKVNSK